MDQVLHAISGLFELANVVSNPHVFIVSHRASACIDRKVLCETKGNLIDPIALQVIPKSLEIAQFGTVGEPRSAVDCVGTESPRSVELLERQAPWIDPRMALRAASYIAMPLKLLSQ